MCSRYQDTQILNTGQVDYAMLDEQRPSKKYEVNVGRSGILEISAEPCIGRFELQISTNYTIDSTANPAISVSRIQDGKVTGTV
mmetsp:Transcript_13173/g.2028  ORF Transcript_13173/g.2028 Transcript_13173/m.2028 type:complete len:84 (+) Transcript_13173:741-992(+)